MGYPDLDGEEQLLRRRTGRADRRPSVEPVVDEAAVAALRGTPEDVRVDDDLLTYIAEVGRRTREDHRVDIGVSPRGVQRLFEAARAMAVVEGQPFVTPDSIADIAVPVLAHRVVLTAEATVSGVDKADVVEDALGRARVPTVD